MKKYLFLLLCVSVFALSSCTVKKDTVRVGWLGPIESDRISYGQPIKNSVELATGEINQKGGIGGKQLEIVYRNASCNTTEVEEQVQNLVKKEKVRIIIASICSKGIQAIAPFVEKEGVMVVTPTASDPKLTQMGFFLLRNALTDAVAGETLAEQLFKKHKSVAILTEEDGFSLEVRNAFLSKYRALGGEVRLDERFSKENYQGPALAEKAMASGAEAIFWNAKTEQIAGDMVKILAEKKYTKALYGNLVSAMERTLDAGGNQLEGMYVQDLPEINKRNPRARQFMEDYKTTYGTTGVAFYAGAAYDLVTLLTGALEAEGEKDLGKLRSHLQRIKNFEGVVGTYGFTEKGEVEGLAFSLKIIEEGKIAPIR